MESVVPEITNFGLRTNGQLNFWVFNTTGVSYSNLSATKSFYIQILQLYA